ncbi:unnamed protein product [Polarella glacialis]|uniref:GST N-terminal domain-containing protein n=1 Tax=Polarella glacialis TaxID=89957 RepID=A0A813LZG9_POLGL|nr:unnamed protein product [Polarella glacialis]
MASSLAGCRKVGRRGAWGRRASLSAGRFSGVARSRACLLPLAVASFSCVVAKYCLLLPGAAFCLTGTACGYTCQSLGVSAVSPVMVRKGFARQALASAPTWPELQTMEPLREGSTVQSDLATQGKPPALTLYRDTNGWCPFCERVWIALREKDIPYDEVLISLFDKPQWFKDMVPTGNVPAVKFSGSGEVVWESEAILRRLDKDFPETKPLFSQPGSIEAVAKLTEGVMNASMGLAYRTGNLSEVSLEDRRMKLVGAIDGLDAHLASGGPFLLGSEVSAADLMAVPMLERYGFQLPYFAAELQIRNPERWPSLARWFDSMEQQPAYGDRVAGDIYSWTAVAPVLMRMFGGQNGTLEGAAADRAAKAEQAASELLATVERNAEAVVGSATLAARLEAARKLLSNHAAVVRDAINTEPKSQKELQRLHPSKAPAVDTALRAAVTSLLAGSLPLEVPAVDAEGAAVQPADLAHACRYVAARLSAPRDMGAPAAVVLRGVLLGLAHVAGAGQGA